MNRPPFPKEHHLLILASSNLYGFSNRNSVLSAAQPTKNRKVWSYLAYASRQFAQSIFILVYTNKQVRKREVFLVSLTFIARSLAYPSGILAINSGMFCLHKTALMICKWKKREKRSTLVQMLNSMKVIIYYYNN